MFICHRVEELVFAHNFQYEINVKFVQSASAKNLKVYKTNARVHTN